MIDIPILWRPFRWAVAGYALAATPLLVLLAVHWPSLTRTDVTVSIAFPFIYPALIGVMLLSTRGVWLVSILVLITGCGVDWILIQRLRGIDEDELAMLASQALQDAGSLLVLSAGVLFAFGGWGWCRFARIHGLKGEVLFGQSVCKANRLTSSIEPATVEHRFEPYVKRQGERHEPLYFHPLRWFGLGYFILASTWLAILFTDRVLPSGTDILAALLFPILPFLFGGILMLPLRVMQTALPLLLAMTFIGISVSLYCVFAGLGDSMTLPVIGRWIGNGQLLFALLPGVLGWTWYRHRRLPDGRVLIGSRKM